MFGLLLDALYQEHDTGAHPERSQRLESIRAGIDQLHGLDVVSLRASPTDSETIALVHDPDYIEWVRTQIESGTGRLDPDTAVCSRSYEVALNAVGGSLAGVDAIMAGQLSQAFFETFYYP